MISRPHAQRLIEEMQMGVVTSTAPKDLDGGQIVRLHQLLREVRGGRGVPPPLSPSPSLPPQAASAPRGL